MGVTVTLVLSTRSGFFAHFLIVGACNSPPARPLANGARARAAAGPAEPHWAQQSSWVQLGQKINLQPGSAQNNFFDGVSICSQSLVQSSTVDGLNSDPDDGELLRGIHPGSAVTFTYANFDNQNTFWRLVACNFDFSHRTTTVDRVRPVGGIAWCCMDASHA